MPALTLFMVWLAMAVNGMLNHEIWRDEMRALSIAIEAEGYSDLPSALKNEGHPLLWYVLLKCAYDLFHTTAVLPVLSFLFAAGIVFMLLFRTNLPFVICIPIIFGSWCLYEYGINCRNYGIAAFFFLLFADSYARRPSAYLRHFIFLALAAQANVYATIMSMFACAWIMINAPGKERISRKAVSGFLLFALSCLAVAYVTYPDNDSLVLDKQLQRMENIGEIWNVGYGFGDLFYTWFDYSYGFITAMIILSLMVFIPRPVTLILVYMAAVVMAFFSLYLRYNYIQHQGMWIYFYIAMLCIHYKDILAYTRSGRLGRYPVYIGLAAFVCIIGSGLFRARQSYGFDLLNPLSDSKGAGAWFNKHAKTGDVIISEPDYIMEPVMYYRYMKFYLPRENRFNSYVHFTKANDSFLSLKKLVHITDSFLNSGRQTFLVIKEQLDPGDSVFRYTYGKEFRIDSAALTDLNKRYLIADSFRTSSFTDEQYYIYRRK